MLEHVVTFDPKVVREGDLGDRDYYGQQVLGLNGNIVTLRANFDFLTNDAYFDYWKVDDQGHVTFNGTHVADIETVPGDFSARNSWLMDYAIRSPISYKSLMLEGVTFIAYYGWPSDYSWSQEGIWLHTLTEDASGQLQGNSEMIVGAEAHLATYGEYMSYNDDTNDAFDVHLFEHDGDVYLAYIGITNGSPWYYWQYIRRFSRSGATLTFVSEARFRTSGPQWATGDYGATLLWPWKREVNELYYAAMGIDADGRYGTIGKYDLDAQEITTGVEPVRWVQQPSEWTTNGENGWFPIPTTDAIIWIWASHQGEHQSRHAELRWYAIKHDLTRSSGIVSLPDNDFTYKISTASRGFTHYSDSVHYLSLRYDLSFDYSPAIVELKWDGSSLSYVKHHMIGDTDGVSGSWDGNITYVEPELDSANLMYVSPCHLAVINDNERNGNQGSLISLFRVADCHAPEFIGGRAVAKLLTFQRSR